MVVAYTEPAPSTIYHCRQSLLNAASTGTPEERKPRVPWTNVISPSCIDTAGAMHCKASADRVKQTKQHADEQDKDIERLSRGWRQTIKAADRYGAHRKRFIGMLSDLQRMWIATLDVLPR